MKTVVLLLVGIFVSGAWAATESTSISKSETSTMAAPIPATHEVYDSKVRQVLGDKKFEEDKRITDLELRANAGSLSRFSFQSSLGYSGSAVNQLSDPNRPNPDNRIGDNRTYLSGSANMRYRINSNTAMNFGTGVKFYTPYQSAIGEDVDRPKNSKTYGVNDPLVGVDRTYSINKTQMRSAIRASVTTDDYYLNKGQWGMVQIAQYFKYTPGMTRWILGMQTSVDFFAYDRKYRPTADKKSGFTADGSVSKYYINLIPSVEYKLTDSVNFNTSIGGNYENLRSEKNWMYWAHQMATWRVGAGWAITHDIYINPYVNFFLEAPAFNTASLNFNTTFSIF